MEEIIKRNDLVLEYLENLSDDKLLSAHNQMCRNQNRYDDEIYFNEEEFFENNFNGRSPFYVLQRAAYGTYDVNDEYVKFDGYANLKSFNFLKDEIYLSEIVEDILENPNDYDIELIDVINIMIKEDTDDGLIHIVDENDDSLTDGFETMSELLEWIDEEGGKYNIVESF